MTTLLMSALAGGAILHQERHLPDHACHRDQAESLRIQSVDCTQSVRCIRGGKARIPRLYNIQSSYLPSAWTPSDLEGMHCLLFPDGEPWPYGLERNRATIE